MSAMAAQAAFPNGLPRYMYGYRWQQGQGPPQVFATYPLDQALPQGGIYVLFTSSSLYRDHDYFSRGADNSGPGPVYPTANPPVLSNLSPQMQGLLLTVLGGPETYDTQWFKQAGGIRLGDIDGFLDYVDTCLNLLVQTGVGAAVVQALANANASTVIVPGGSNQNAFNPGPAGTTIYRIASQLNMGIDPADRQLLDEMIAGRYANAQQRYNNFAIDIRQAPLYTLFAPANAFVPAFLNGRFLFQGADITGQVLSTWIQGNNPAFDTFLQGPGEVVNGVILRKFFCLALIVLLYQWSQPGPGVNRVRVEFHTGRSGRNNLHDANFRPPAVGLGHELIHAWNEVRGASPGMEMYHFSQTAYELLATGIGPFQANAYPTTENALRAQWPNVQHPDPSNQWVAAPPLRLAYSPPGPGETAAGLRSRAGGAI